MYRVVIDNIDEMMPVIYTPTVGLACQQFGHIDRRPRGLYVSAADRGRVAQLLANWPARAVDIIVVTDGERILGSAISAPTAWASRSASWRCTPRAPVQFEDFANHRAFALLARYRDRVPCFNDDIQGTAAVTLAGIDSALRVTGGALAEVKLDGRTRVPRQGNNSCIFPGGGLGAIASHARRVTDEMFLAAAVAEVAYARGQAVRTRPDDVLADVRSRMYEPKYATYA